MSQQAANSGLPHPLTDEIWAAAAPFVPMPQDAFQFAEGVQEQIHFSNDFSISHFGAREQAQVISAVESLYRDEIMPQYMLVLRRLREMYNLAWRPQQLRMLCTTMPQLDIHDEGRAGRRFNILLKQPPPGTGFFVNETDVEDPYPEWLWQQIAKFLEKEARRTWPNVRWPGSRYEFSKWIQTQVRCLKGYSLGRVCHMTQLGIQKRQLLGYRQGSMVPYTLSDDYKKFKNAMLRRPGPGQLTSGGDCITSWDEVGALLRTMLIESGGTVQLSSLKALFKKRFHRELSESALGHTKLSELVLDEQLRGNFWITQVGTQWQVYTPLPGIDDNIADEGTAPLERWSSNHGDERCFTCEGRAPFRLNCSICSWRVFTCGNCRHCPHCKASGEPCEIVEISEDSSLSSDVDDS